MKLTVKCRSNVSLVAYSVELTQWPFRAFEWLERGFASWIFTIWKLAGSIKRSSWPSFQLFLFSCRFSSGWYKKKVRGIVIGRGIHFPLFCVFSLFFLIFPPYLQTCQVMLVKVHHSAQDTRTLGLIMMGPRWKHPRLVKAFKSFFFWPHRCRH